MTGPKAQSSPQGMSDAPRLSANLDAHVLRGYREYVLSSLHFQMPYPLGEHFVDRAKVVIRFPDTQRLNTFLKVASTIGHRPTGADYLRRMPCVVLKL